MSDVLLRVEGVSKKFCKTLKRSMLYGMKDITESMLGMAPETDRLRPGEFWSIDDVSFEVRRGECLGLIGPNGAGKSTLLKLLNGIISPDRGRIEINGRVGALIEVTAGFHPMLTGRENIYISGSILGLSKKEIDRKFKEIVEFAELGDFIDTPVKHYSSGMNVRLGFAIAVQLKPDVLLIDEVLAVGDAGFRIKCINAIAKITKSAAVIFVSHSIPDIARISNSICTLDSGKAIYLGNNVPTGIEYYYNCFDVNKEMIAGNGQAKIHKIEFESNGKRDINKINYMDGLLIHLFFTIDTAIKYPTINLSFENIGAQLVAQCNSINNKVRFYNKGEILHITIKLDKVNFNPGIYIVTAWVLDETRSTVLLQYSSPKELEISGEFIGYAPVQLIGEWHVKHKGQNLF